MRLKTPAYDLEIDLSGLRCPSLLIAVIEAMRGLNPGQVLKIIATDLNAPSSITAWSNQSRQRLLDLYEENTQYFFYLERTAELLSQPQSAASFVTSKDGQHDHKS